MKKASPRPHLGSCPLCEQGLIRIARCPHCEEWSAICDDCEAIWGDPHAVFDAKPNSQHPYCPHCKESVRKWSFGTKQEISKAGFADLIEGTSQ
ncbi:hypothetical protein SH661x_001109 [Planctomicrobium sp. SH661]|uniref:hypothetical protein n=1 Tax=Planctomicrobium sp. SH661 TaxID=3448124 RepID=UPI003F5B5E69